MSIAAPTVSWNWITGKRFDLLWYIGACATGYLLIYLNVGLQVPALLLLWFWIVAVDGPHIFATISRTYLDTEERKERSRLLLGSLLWFLPGPVLVFLGIAVDTVVPYVIFLAFARLWAYWHVVRQHYGFLVLYQKKNGEAAGKANPVDYWTFYVLMLAPFASFLIRHPEARSQLGLNAAVSLPEQLMVIILHMAIVVAVIFYGLNEWRIFRSGKSWNAPKNLFLLACVPLHFVIFLHPYISTKIDLILFAVLVTFYHNIQYHGIVWFYNRNRYGNDPKGERFGLSSVVSRNFATYYIAGIVFTLIYRYSNWYLMGLEVPLLAGPNAISEIQLGLQFKVSDLVFATWWGFAFNHYYLDQKIWRVSRDRRLNRELGLPA